MKIVKCSKIKNTGVYVDFRWPIELSEFKSFNLIYGWNGSGKTTLSRLLRFLENNDYLPEDWKPEFKIDIENGEVSDKNPNSLVGSICVFNVDFIAEHINWSEGRTKKLLIGEPSKMLDKKLFSYKDTLEKNIKKKNEEDKKINKAKNTHDKFLQGRASEIKNRLTTSISDKYRNYNKSNLREVLEKLESQDVSKYNLSDEKEAELNAEIQQNYISELSIEEIPQSLNPSLLQEAQDALLNSPMPSFMESLRKDSDLNAWVKKGYDLHKERGESICQFCLQSLPPSRMDDLEKHFSDEYKKFTDEINRIYLNLAESRDKYLKINLPPSADIYPKFQKDYKKPQSDFYEEKFKWQEKIDQILSLLRQKQKNPFDKIESEFFEEIIQIESKIQSHLNSVNMFVEKHNSNSQNLSNHIANAKKIIEYSMAIKLLDEYRELEDDISELKQSMDNIAKTIESLQDELEVLERTVIQPKIGEENINKNLSRFLGRKDIRLKYEKDGYSIMRNGKKANNLSESEKTAIALIYFISKIHEGKDVREKIIVIDDPISSLDSQSTHFALSYIKSNIIEAKQIFLLTHNFYCLKEAKKWRAGKGFPKENCVFYMLECRMPNATESQREATLGILDPLLEKYDSEYHFLFSQLYKCHLEMSKMTLEDMYPLANMARKVLETFLAFKVPQTTKVEEQLNQLGVNDGDEHHLLKRFLDVSSHADSPERMTEFPPTSLEEIKKIIDSLISLIRKADSKHFTGMKSVVDGQIASLNQNPVTS